MDLWFISSIVYFSIAFLSFIPVLSVLLKRIKFSKEEPFNESSYFNDDEKKKLGQNYARMQGALLYSKNQVLKYKSFHYYTLIWTIPSSVAIPILIQYISNISSKIFLTLVSAFCAILLSFHKAFNVEESYKTSRLSESAFYDTVRRLIERPESFGNTKEVQLASYFAEVEVIRKSMREAELSSIPTLTETKEIFKGIMENKR